jgi:hypothetical protein
MNAALKLGQAGRDAEWSRIVVEWIETEGGAFLTPKLFGKMQGSKLGSPTCS